MTPHEFDAILRATFDDGRLSRSERKALRQRLDEAGVDANQRHQFRSQAFALARSALHDGRDGAVVDWLEDIIKSLRTQGAAQPVAAPEAYFSPGDECLAKLRGLFDSVRDQADVCVFTITDDRLAESIVRAHRRGVRVRIITDNHKADDLGSDVDRLAAQGIPVRVDQTDDHMHHKFAIFDGRRMVTGSYNWTRSAAGRNWENLIVSGDHGLIGRFSQEFERLWVRLRAGGH